MYYLKLPIAGLWLLGIYVLAILEAISLFLYLVITQYEPPKRHEIQPIQPERIILYATTLN